MKPSLPQPSGIEKKTMKISTWNVNGYRSIIKKGFAGWFRENGADVVCLQEIKCRPEQIEPEYVNYPGYLSVWNPADRAGYSGVVTFTRLQPLETGYGLGDDEFDGEGRVIWMQFDGFRLFNVYFPSGQRGLERVEYKLRFYKRLLSICDDLIRRGMNIILCGDFNTAHTEIDLANPKGNKNTSGFLQVEREMVDEYLRHHFVDVFRQIYPEKIEYTWWTYVTNARARNIGWRLDYFLVSEGLLSRVKAVEIQGGIQGSDHCPVNLIIENFA